MKKVFAWICILVIVLTQFTVFASGTPNAVLDARNSVVRIIADTPFGSQFGTGFAIGTQKPVKFIVTNYHVIDGADEISILLNRDNLIQATVQTALPGSDLAVLRLTTPLHNIEPAVINDKKAKEGTKGYALGYPAAADILSDTITGNKEDITITDGIISALQTVPFESGLQPVNVYQINAAINPGNSGGPFVNSKGEVIGINSWGVNGADAINTSIRVEDLTAVLKQNGIPYLRSQSLNLVWIILVVAIVLVLAALAFLVYRLVSSRKQPKAVLYGLNGEFAGERFYLPPEGVNIGRDASMCQIVLPLDSPKVSRSHCNLRYVPEDKNFVITDLASANGTYLMNGVQLRAKTPTTLASGTKFYLGDETTMFRVGLED